MELMDELDANRRLEDSQDIVRSGTTRLILRQAKPLPVVKFDPDFKTPLSQPDDLPYFERVLQAKVRPLTDGEVASTQVGELRVGDLVVELDPLLVMDPIRPITMLDEIRFEQNLVLPTGAIDKEWDFQIFAIHPHYSGNLVTKLQIMIRRKQVKTQGGSDVPAF